MVGVKVSMSNLLSVFCVPGIVFPSPFVRTVGLVKCGRSLI